MSPHLLAIVGPALATILFASLVLTAVAFVSLFLDDWRKARRRQQTPSNVVALTCPTCGQPRRSA